MPNSGPMYESVKAVHRRDMLELRERKAKAKAEAENPPAEPEPKKPKVEPVKGFKGGDPSLIGKLGGRPKKGFEKNKKPPAQPPEPTLMELQPDKKQKYFAEKKKNGGNQYRAALAAGYTESMAKQACRKVETPDYRLAEQDARARFAEKLRAKIPDEKLITKIEEGLEAKTTEFFSDKGLVIETRDTVDFGERRKYIDMALQNSERKTADRHQIEHTNVMDASTARRLADLGEMFFGNISPQELQELRRSHVQYCQGCGEPHPLGEHTKPIIDALPESEALPDATG